MFSFSKKQKRLDVLIIEDSDAYVFLLTQKFNKHPNVFIDSIDSVEKATWMLTDKEYGLVLLDNSLNGMDGEFSLPIIKDLVGDVKIVIMTSSEEGAKRLDRIYKNVVHKEEITDEFISSLINDSNGSK